MTSKSSKLPLVSQLRLFIDKGGLIRCNGRIHNAPVLKVPLFTTSQTSLYQNHDL